MATGVATKLALCDAAFSRILHYTKNQIEKCLKQLSWCKSEHALSLLLSGSSNGITTILYSCSIGFCKTTSLNWSSLVMKVDTRNCKTLCCTCRMVVILQYIQVFMVYNPIGLSDYNQSITLYYIGLHCIWNWIMQGQYITIRMKAYANCCGWWLVRPSYMIDRWISYLAYIVMIRQGFF